VFAEEDQTQRSEVNARSSYPIHFADLSVGSVFAAGGSASVHDAQYNGMRVAVKRFYCDDSDVARPVKTCGPILRLLCTAPVHICCDGEVQRRGPLVSR
jgi:hypothetical protein